MSLSLKSATQTLRATYLAPTARSVQRAWQWWVSELKSMLPDDLRQIVEAANQRLVVTQDSTGFLLQHGSPEQIREIGRIPSATDDAPGFTLPDNIHRTVLLLPQDKVLSRAMTLPLAAEENLREVLAFEMDSQTPFGADQVYYDYVVTGRTPASKALSLQLFVAPRVVVDESLSVLGAKDIVPDVVMAHIAGNPGGHEFNLLPADRRRSRRISLHRMNLSLAILAVFLLVVAVVSPLLEKNRTIRSLETEVSEATIGARASNQLRQEVEDLVAGSRYLVEKKQAGPTMTQLLDDMTGVIPDDSWVDRIDINGGEIQLRGQSASAAGLIGLIEASPAFGNARFRSPLTQVARTNQERFHLSADAKQDLDK